MADKDPHIKIHTEVDEKGLDKGLKQVHDKVKHTTEEGESMFKKMFEALALEKLVEKGLEVVSDFFKESIEDAKNAEVNVVQLKNSLENLGKAGSFDSILEGSEELSKKFIISKQDIIKSTTALETYGKLTQKQIKDLEPVILNYSKKTGKSVEESTDDIIRGLEGQGRGLKKVGIELKAGGSLAQNYTTILNDLGEKVDGAADAFNKTAAGGMAKFHLAIEELHESVGAKLLPAIADLASSFVPLIDQIGPLVDELMPILTTSLKTLAPLFSTLGTNVIQILKPLGDVFGIIIDALNQLMPLLTPILKLLGDMGATLLKELTPAFKELVTAITPIIKELLPIFQSALEFLSPVISILAKGIVVLAHGISILLNIINAIVKPITAVTKYFLDFSSKALKPVIDKVKEAYEWIAKLFDKVSDFLGLGNNKDKDGVTKTYEKQAEAAKESAEEQGKAMDYVDKKAEAAALKAQKRQEQLAKKEKKDLKTLLGERLKAIEAHEKLNVLSTQEGTKDRVQAEKISSAKIISFYEETGKSGKKVYEELGMSADEWALKKFELNKEVADADGAFYDNQKKLSDDAAEKEKDRQQDVLDAAQKQADDMEKLVADNLEKIKAKREKDKQDQLDTIDTISGYARSAMEIGQNIAEIANNADKARLKNGEKLSVETQKKEFNRKKALSLGAAAINIAEAVTKAIAESPMTGGLPGSAIAGIAGAAEIAKILSSKFSPEGGETSAPSTGTSIPSIPSTLSAGQVQNIGKVVPTISLQGNAPSTVQVSVSETDIRKVTQRISVLQTRTRH